MPTRRSMGSPRTISPAGGRWKPQAGRSGAFIHHGQLRDFQGRFAGGGGGVAWMGIEASVAYMEDLKRKTDAGAQRAANRLVQETVMWMKANAPWQDRTGDARSELQGNIQFNSDSEAASVIRIFLGHGVDYGIHLELGMGGRFQIIKPGIDRLAAKLPESVVREMNV